jgi:hypothetical protein
MIYAVPLGIVAGLLLGGRLSGLETLRFRWGWLAIAGLLVQLVLFLGPVASRIGDLGVPLYLGSTALVLAAIAANYRVPGLPIVTLGAALNLAVIVANGGYMPASVTAYAEHGNVASAGYSNTRVLVEPILAPLTDTIVLPSWLPFTNVISVGDVLIAAGTTAAIALAMRARSPATASPDGAVGHG